MIKNEDIDKITTTYKDSLINTGYQIAKNEWLFKGFVIGFFTCTILTFIIQMVIYFLKG